MGPAGNLAVMEVVWVARSKNFTTVVDDGDRRETLLALRRIVAVRIQECESARDIAPLVSRFMELEREIAALPDPSRNKVAQLLAG